MIWKFALAVLFCNHATSGYCFSVQQSRTLYVFPTKDQCRNKSSCGTLDDYAATTNTTTSNTNFIFINEHYTLTKSITFSNLSKIALRLCEACCKSAVINCMPGAGLKFEHIDGLEIVGLTLHNCSREHSNEKLYLNYTLHAALYCFKPHYVWSHCWAHPRTWSFFLYAKWVLNYSTLLFSVQYWYKKCNRRQHYSSNVKAQIVASPRWK